MKEVSAKKNSTKKPNSKKKIENEKEDRYELVDFVVKHFRIHSWKEFSGHHYFANDILHLLNDVTELFRSEKSLCHISPPVTIVGDLNGQFQDLIRIFNIKNEKCKKEDEWKQVFSTEKFVFLGDYTENSPYNLETVCLLFGLKMLYNERYILLRGHQEAFATTEFRDQILKRFPGGPGEDIWQKFKIAFNLLPAAAVVGEKILCVHGGISANVKKSVNEWKKIPKPDQVETLNPTIRDLIFSCPIDDDGVVAESNDPIYFTSVEKSHQTKLFNEAAVREFCTKTNIELIVRSHEIFKHGFRFIAEKKMITIFSAPSYKNNKNKAAFLRVDPEGVVSIIQLRPTDKKKEDDEMKKKSRKHKNIKEEYFEDEDSVRATEETLEGKKGKKKEEKKEENNKSKEHNGIREKQTTVSKRSKENESFYDND